MFTQKLFTFLLTTLEEILNRCSLNMFNKKVINSKFYYTSKKQK